MLILLLVIDMSEVKGGLAAGLLSTNWDEVSTPTTRQEKQDFEITEEKLKQRSSPRGEQENNKLSGGTRKLLNKQFITKLLPEINTEASTPYERVNLEYLKKIVMVLDAKSKVQSVLCSCNTYIIYEKEVDIIRQDNEMMKELTRKNEESQHELRVSIEETTKELKIENDSNQKQIQALIEERTTLVARIRELNLK